MSWLPVFAGKSSAKGGMHRQGGLRDAIKLAEEIYREFLK